MDIIKTHKKKKKRKTQKPTRRIPPTQIVQKQLTYERQCLRAQQPNIQKTTRNRHQIAARNKQTTRKGKQTNTHASNRKLTRKTQVKYRNNNNNNINNNK
jgi:hypothetical protein